MTINVSPDDPFLTTGQVAEIFQVKEFTVRKWINDKDLKAVKIGKSWRIQQSEVSRFANKMYGDEA